MYFIIPFIVGVNVCNNTLLFYINGLNTNVRTSDDALKASGKVGEHS